jgi:acyl carrier protein phosphodiesterase
MNWLAHVFLSEPEIEFRLGNLLADVIKRQDRPAMPPNFQRGLRRHQIIDAFTDTHPIVRRSRARLTGNYQHTRGILIDIFYDHFLALNWANYCSEPLESFTARLYTDIRLHPIDLPREAQIAVDRMLRDDRLTSYRTIEGIESALHRVSLYLSARIGRKYALELATAELRDQFAGLGGDFAEFFPLLQTHVGKADRTLSPH